MQNFKKFLKVPKSGYTNNGQNNVTQTEDLRRTLNKLKEVSPNNNKAEEEKKQGEKIDAKKEDISLSLK